MRRLRVLLALLLLGCGLLVAQVLPPTPQRWVTDGPGLLSPGVRAQLDGRLEAYQKATGHQVLVWIGTTTGPQPLEDWSVKTFASWKVGRAGLDDGLAIFVLAADHKVRLEVGYGLEGAVPDAVASRIIQEAILPRLKAGDADGALTAGVGLVLKAAGGETGTAQAADLPAHQPLSPLAWILIGVAGLGLLVLAITNPGLAVWLLFYLLSGGRGGRGSGEGGGGFSGGGGRSGGGGASGSW
jgi:uncharacterized protein